MHTPQRGASDSGESATPTTPSTAEALAALVRTPSIRVALGFAALVAIPVVGSIYFLKPAFSYLFPGNATATIVRRMLQVVLMTRCLYLAIRPMMTHDSRNRSAAIRIPMYSPSPKAKRIEFRTPDPSCNGYIAFSAMLMAVIDGIENKIDPGDPLDKDIYGLPPEELAEIPSAPGSLEEALEALKEDHEFLLKGDVFTKDVIDTWIEYKTENEVNAVKLRPHPHEFFLYFDI